MTQQSYSQAYTLRKPNLKKTHVSHYSLQHYLQQVEHGSNLDEWIKKLWYLYTMEYYSAIKKNTFESVLMRWMNLEPVIQSEVSLREKDKYCILTHIYGMQKNNTEEFIFQSKPFNIMVIQVYAPTRNAEEAEVEQFYEDLQDLLDEHLKKISFSLQRTGMEKQEVKKHLE